MQRTESDTKKKSELDGKGPSFPQLFKPPVNAAPVKAVAAPELPHGISFGEVGEAHRAIGSGTVAAGRSISGLVGSCRLRTRGACGRAEVDCEAEEKEFDEEFGDGSDKLLTKKRKRGDVHEPHQRVKP
ncbi:hypothetical protein LINPERHAP2_LOCUS24605 [Linum perenne]